MMDDKYLAEIKARCEAFKKSGENYGVVFPEQIRSVLLDDGYEEQWSDLAAHASLDVNALLAEVERLNAYESIDLLPEQIEAMQGHNIALIEENAAKDQQIATLKKALEIASMEVNVAFETLESHHVITMERKASGTQENIDAWIQKAKQAQEQEEKK